MINAKYVYERYIIQKNIFHNKSFNGCFNKLSLENLLKLNTMANYFNTKYQNIDLDEYLKCGFEIWKNFSINQIDSKKIFLKYKTKDKIRKRNCLETSQNDILKSIDYVKTIYIDIGNYCDNMNIIRQPIIDYIHNKIDAIFLVFLIENRYLNPLNDEEKALISYIMTNYKELKLKVYKNHEFIMGNIMAKEEKQPYLDDPVKNKKKITKEELILSGDTLTEVKEKKKNYKENKLNE